MPSQISICIPTFNRCAMLREAIDSVLSQEFRDYELLVSDNASMDGTEELLTSIRDPRVVYIRHSENRGSGMNHLRCIGKSSGEWILFLHDDDLLAPGSLRLVHDVLERCSEYAVMLPPYTSWIGDGNPLDNCLRLLNGISPCSTLYRRDFALEHWPPPENDCCDWEVLVLAALNGYRFGFYDFEYIIRRDHSGQESKRILRDGTGNRVMAGFAGRLSELIRLPEWEPICARIARTWKTRQLMTLARFFHHASKLDHYRVLKRAAAAEGKWQWVSTKGAYILAETALGRTTATRLLETAKRVARVTPR